MCMSIGLFCGISKLINKLSSCIIAISDAAFVHFAFTIDFKKFF